MTNYFFKSVLLVVIPVTGFSGYCVCRDLYTAAEIIAEGRDPALVVGDVVL